MRGGAGGKAKGRKKSGEERGKLGSSGGRKIERAEKTMDGLGGRTVIRARATGRRERESS